MTTPNETLLVVGYGSLLSGYGLLAARRNGRSKLIALDAEPAILINARRGLAKPSSHGDYLAMDIEPCDATSPIGARTGLSINEGSGIGGLLLTFGRSSAPLIARREEYDPDAFLRLIKLADRAGASLGEFLLDIAEGVSFNLLAYRQALRRLLGYTSPGYVFHPVPIEDGRIAIVAIGSGYEGSGDPTVISRRRECGIDRLHSFASALEIASVKVDRVGQIGYFAECLLGGIHGIAMDDLMNAFDPAAPWAGELAACVNAAMVHEANHFLSATSLQEQRYRELFGASGPHTSLNPLLKLVRVE